jgi:hypothetical protein
MMGNERHLTSLDLDRVELGGPDSGEGTRIQSHLSVCPACATRRSEHAALVSRFRVAVLPRTVDVVAAGRRSGARGFRLLALAVALPALAGLALVVRVGRPVAPPAEPAPQIGVKGAAVMHVFARLGGPAPQVPGAVVKVLEGSRLSAGDALRFVLDPTGLPYVLIASVDGAGQINIYYPYGGESSARVDERATVSVPHSIVLDQAPGPERLFALFSREPISARVVRQALAGTAAAGAPAIRATRQLAIGGTVQATLLFEKELAR